MRSENGMAIEGCSLGAMYSVHKRGWDVTIFVDGDPDKMTATIDNKMMQLNGEFVPPTARLKAGIFKFVPHDR